MHQHPSHHLRVKTDSEMELVLEKMEKIKKQGEREGRFLKVDIILALTHFSSTKTMSSF